MPEFKVIARLHFDEQTMFVAANNTRSAVSDVVAKTVLSLSVS
ncbi:hypothetical protein SAMN05216337_11014 [Bradyrhizobium brasilense]|uniref:Uncharacterized protein n=1 Tax=Bradyrhizobium brasilense TaxID=1419277 RepID=A0A1G7QNM0_9BRAD|nr:hypothetical protein [Bradyrhizobium brasilense]SDG00116.1 hypothetical protein SAMN05216337_11014 [Bradyrhizobium brasilense]